MHVVQTMRQEGTETRACITGTATRVYIEKDAGKNASSLSSTRTGCSTDTPSLSSLAPQDTNLPPQKPSLSSLQHPKTLRLCSAN